MILGAQRFLDPLYGRTALDDFEFALLQSPEFQRLRYVRMCNINSMLITGASEISRFEHSLGVLRLAKEWLAAHPLSDSGGRAFLAAALLHDLQTGPFGHSFQYILEDNKVDGDFLHDDLVHGYRSQYHQELLARAAFAGSPFTTRKLLGNAWAQIGDLIKGRGALGRLISGDLDLDNIDNVVRLGFHAGIADRSDAQLAIMLARDLNVTDSALTISPISVGRIERWQEVRQRLYELLLLDWAEFSAKGMLTRALELAVDVKHIEADSWLLTDGQLLDYLDQNTPAEFEEVRELVRRVRVGDLYHPVALLRSSAVAQYERLGQVAAKRALEVAITACIRKNVKQQGKIFVHFIVDRKKTNRAVRVQVRPTGADLVIGTDSNSLLIGVFSSRAVQKSVTVQMEKCVMDVLSRHGLGDLLPLVDPLREDERAVTEDPQLRLL